LVLYDDFHLSFATRITVSSMLRLLLVSYCYSTCHVIIYFSSVFSLLYMSWCYDVKKCTMGVLGPGTRTDIRVWWDVLYDGYENAMGAGTVKYAMHYLFPFILFDTTQIIVCVTDSGIHGILQICNGSYEIIPVCYSHRTFLFTLFSSNLS
jgi:hypothetical protein